MNIYKQQGFTLVELAIVMIIIGLLIGGILKGQELVNQSRISSTITHIESLDGALITFKDKYNDIPGDMVDASDRLPNCDQRPCSISNGASGSGLIGNGLTPLNAPGTNDEGTRAFIHLAAANLISGVDINGIASFGSALPEASVGGGFWICADTDGNLGAGTAPSRRGHYLTLNGELEDVTVATSTDITALETQQIDRKLDDGNARSGDIIATGNDCADATGEYQEGNVNASCAMFMKTSI